MYCRGATRLTAALLTVVLPGGCTLASDTADGECGALPEGFTTRDVDVGDAVMHIVVR